MVTKGNVLVVDDEINLCRIIGAKLARSGYSVVAVHDGLQAVEKVRESDFDVVLLDLILPKMDGLSALAQIRTIRDALPVIVMTACENAEAVEQAKSYGVSAYVNKPFDLDSLVSLISSTSRAGVGYRDRTMADTTVLFSRQQPLTLEVSNGHKSCIYGSRIADKDERTLSVAAPQCDAGAVEIRPGSSVKICLAAGDAFYSFATHVLRSAESPEPVLVLDKPGVIYRVQRRQHPRYPICVPLGYARCDDDSIDEEFDFGIGETIDISAGGASILVPEEILPGEMLKIELRPKSEQDVISTVAHVLRSRASGEPGRTGYVLGCSFILADGSIQKLLKS